MNKALGWTVAALLALGVTASGCGGSGNKNNTDGGTHGTQVCTPSQASCVNDGIAVTCNADGTALIPTQCGVGQKCNNGACVADPNAPCTAADNTCSDSTHALLCTTNGAMSTACPANTACQGPGVCVGSCVVGSSDCLDDGTVITCTDGFHYTQTACGAGSSCVQTGTDPYDTAACQPNGCTPDPTGCTVSICGDMTGGSGTATNTVSTCVATPTGYQWLATSCAGGTTCNSQANSCNGNAVAACEGQCHPGDTTCNGYTGYVTCGADGTWGTTVTACNADATNAPYICFNSLLGQGICGDVACYNGNTNSQVSTGAGACDNDGKFHLCGPDGKVSSDGSACMTGSCVPTNVSSNYPGAYQPGTCAGPCNDGDQHCVDSEVYQTCTNGKWVTTTCAGGKGCIDLTTAGPPAIFCGDCAPGTHQCGANGAIETCGTDGTWGADTTCAMGTCLDLPNAGDSACIAECFPGKPVCMGNSVSVQGSLAQGTDQVGTCTAQGTIPASGTPCDANTYCRQGPSQDHQSGVSLGCVACVGTQNEYGVVDSYCNGGSVDNCKADNSGFQETACDSDHPTCVDPKTGTCGNGCFFFYSPTYNSFEFTCPNPVTESSFSGYGQTCTAVAGGTGPQVCGATPDCCNGYCNAATTDSPVYCQ